MIRSVFDDWVDRARAVTCRSFLEQRGFWTHRMHGDTGVPCPACGGTDRFAVNLKKNVWYCRKSGIGGDAIALVRHIDAVPFLAAVEILAGEPPPNAAGESGAEREARVARAEAHASIMTAQALQSSAEYERYRQR